VLVEILCPFKTEHERSEAFQSMRNEPVTLPAKLVGDFPHQVMCDNTCFIATANKPDC